MKVIANTGPGKLEWQEWPLPQVAAGQVRIRTGACGICATDLAMIAGWKRTGFPSIPGHEWAGTVDAVGAEVDPALVGSRCVAENVLADGGEVGFEHAGGYAQYFISEASNVQRLPADFPLARAALIEPLAVTVRGLRRLGLDSHTDVLVLGDGPIGLLCVMLLRHLGVPAVILAGGRPGRLEVGRSLGAVETIDFHQTGDDLAQAILQRHRGPFVQVIEASGSSNALAAALRVAAREGKVLLLGDYGASRAAFAWSDVLHQELVLIGSNASAGAWPEAVNMAVQGGLPLDRLVTHRLPAEQFLQGYELTRDGRDGVVKVVLEWP